MPTSVNESAIEKTTREASERRTFVQNAIADVPQACIDLMLVVVNDDQEHRSASFWLGEAFVYVHKYQDRLRKYAAERAEAKLRKENENLFSKYILMHPPKDAAELLKVMQAYKICPQVSVPESATQSTAKAA
jgi:hypothetical protein